MPVFRNSRSLLSVILSFVCFLSAAGCSKGEPIYRIELLDCDPLLNDSSEYVSSWVICRNIRGINTIGRGFSIRWTGSGRSAVTAVKYGVFFRSAT